MSNNYIKDLLEHAHKSCYSHKEEILSSTLCGCFSCEGTFPPTEIEEWIEESIGKCKTAICPKCGIDSVLSSNFPITDKQFLRQMNNFWF